MLAHATYVEIASRLSRSSPRSSARCPCREAGAREKLAQRDDFTGDPTDGHPARPLEVACGRGGALEVHHVVKRAQGGSDFDLDRLAALSPPCPPRW